MKIPVLIGVIACAGAQAGEVAQFSFGGVSERHFNPTRGEFTARLRGAVIADASDAVSIFINDRSIDAGEITVRDAAVIVNYRFEEGVNDVTIIALSAEGDQLHGDALLWAGGNTLVIDLVNAGLMPVDSAKVSVSLASNTAIAAYGESHGGTIRFDNLPPLPLLVRATSASAGTATAATRGDAGSLLLMLEESD